jgi:N-acetylmuramoyl-L-alanine amidase
MKFLKWIISLFNIKEENKKIPDELPVKFPQDLPPKPSNAKKIALLVGHGAGDSGAVGWNKVEEHDYNSFVAEYVSKSKTNKIIQVFYKAKTGSWGPTYLKVGVFNPDVTIELHLNATEGAVGCEVLCLKNHNQSAVIGRKFAEAFCAKFNRKMRRDKGILWISSGDRGHGNLLAASAISPVAILVEPFFIDTKSEWIEKEVYAEFVADFVNSL